MSDALRRKVMADAPYRCGYCLMSQRITAMPMRVEHLISLAVGGTSAEENLWLACPLWNGSKATKTHAIDPETGEEALLCNPRRHVWRAHVRWSDDGVEIIGLTPCGRATVAALKRNNESLTRARHRWVLAGWHPPTS
jgi:HNH endonuclease